MDSAQNPCSDPSLAGLKLFQQYLLKGKTGTYISLIRISAKKTEQNKNLKKLEDFINHQLYQSPILLFNKSYDTIPLTKSESPED